MKRYGSVSVWCLLLGSIVQAGESLPGIRALAFSPDSKLLAAVAGEPKEKGILAVWEMPSRKLRFVIQSKQGIPTVAFSPDGKTLAIGGFTETAKIVDATSGKVLREFADNGTAARGVAFSPDGKTLAVCSYDKFIKFWNVATGELQKALNAHNNWIYSVAYTKDGKILASSSSDNTVKLWDASSHRLLHTFKYDGIVRRVFFTADDRNIIIASWDGSVEMRDVQSGELRLSLDGPEGADTAACTPDGRTIVVIRRHPQIFSTQKEELTPEKRERILRLIAEMDDVSYTKREDATEALRKIGHVAEPELRKAMKESASAEVRIRARRLRTEVRDPAPTHTLRGHRADVETLAMSPDGQCLATGGRDGLVKLWDLRTYAEIATLSLTGQEQPFQARRVEY